jgi:hypothetical protein
MRTAAVAVPSSWLDRVRAAPTVHTPVQPAHSRAVRGPSQPVGGQGQGPADYPVERRDYALRDVVSLTSKAAAVGPSVGIYAVRLLDVPLPWTSMRTVYRLLGLARSYGAETVDAACARALELDVVDVNKVARMLE